MPTGIIVLATFEITSNMELTVTTPALLFPAIAILMLGYVNRYIATTVVIRNFKKDYDGGYKHNDLVKQLTFLQRRIELFRYMLSIAVTALMSACLSMYFVFIDNQLAAKYVFGLSLLLMIGSLALSLTETSLSNKSLGIELDDMLKREAHAKK